MKELWMQRFKCITTVCELTIHFTSGQKTGSCVTCLVINKVTNTLQQLVFVWYTTPGASLELASSLHIFFKNNLAEIVQSGDNIGPPCQFVSLPY